MQRSDNERFFMQVSTIIRELKRMSTQTQITSMIRRQQVIKGVSFGAKLSKELIVWTVNQIVNGDNTIYVTKSPFHRARFHCCERTSQVHTIIIVILQGKNKDIWPFTFPIYLDLYRYRRMCNNRNAVPDSRYQSNFRNKMCQMDHGSC